MWNDVTCVGLVVSWEEISLVAGEVAPRNTAKKVGNLKRFGHVFNFFLGYIIILLWSSNPFLGSVDGLKKKLINFKPFQRAQYSNEKLEAMGALCGFFGDLPGSDPRPDSTDVSSNAHRVCRNHLS